VTPDPRDLLGRDEGTALLIIDMQNDFVRPGAPIATPRGMEIVPLIRSLADAARQKGFPIIYTQEMHRPDHGDFGIELHFEPPHCIEGSDGAEIVGELTPAKNDILIQRKRRYDAFLGTDLDLVLRSHGVGNLLITGVCTDICVMSTVQHARNLDYRCFVVADAVDGSSEERHRAALLCMEHVFAYVGESAEIRELFDFTPLRDEEKVAAT
jgi:biuret amidohydrolase